MNAYETGNDDKYEILYIDESVTQQQLDLLQKVKSSRDARAVEAALERVRNAAKDPNANTMPVLIEAVQSYATVGEISDALRDVFGTYQEPALF